MACQCADFPRKRLLSLPAVRESIRSSWLRVAILARKFVFRQGLWIEDLRIPPGQECSNGSLILLAVVLWRTFFIRSSASLRVRLPKRIRYEAP
jgi:hypothetical protein